MKCKDCQLACYDLIDRSLSTSAEAEVMAHVRGCPQCRAFLEAEGRRMRVWPRLLGVAAKGMSLPPDASERVFHALEVSRGDGLRHRMMRWRENRFSPASFRWLAFAASVLVAVGLGLGTCLTKDCFPGAKGNAWTENAADVAMPAIRVVNQKRTQGLDVPRTLPGLVTLESGEVVVRLQTGVELALVGPAKVDVQNGLRVYLEQGQLLARVPHWATGFTVWTRELEIRDLGTVFGVQVCEDASDVFVFKGSVQVNEAGFGEWGRKTSGPGVGVCAAGEGVRAVSGESPAKIAADWPEAKRMFGTVQAGRAFHNPSKALKTASRIADLWAERYRPGSNLVAKKAGIGNGIPLEKTPWARTSAPQQEVSDMNKSSVAAIVSAAAVVAGAGSSGATSAPIQVDTSPGGSQHWHMVFTRDVALRWDWNAAATHAELEISGMDGSFTTNFTSVVSNCQWRAFSPDMPSAEDVYDLKMTFYNGSDVVVGVLTSRLAVVTAAFGRTVVVPATAASAWTKVRGNVVIPYDAGWAAADAGAANGRIVIAKAGGMTQTNALSGAAGHFGWKLKNSDWGCGTFNLALTFRGTESEWDATLMRSADGTILGVR